MKYDDVTTNPIWRTAAILKIVFLAISRRFIARLPRNSVGRRIIMFRHKSRDQNIKFRKFKMADGRHFENVFFRYISAENHPISTKFCMQMQILVPITATSQNIKILQIQYGGQPPYWKSFFGYISTIYCPINATFGTKKQDQVRHRSRDQNAKFRKFKMADGRHFENGLIAISQSRIIHFQWDLICWCRFSF